VNSSSSKYTKDFSRTNRLPIHPSVHPTTLQRSSSKLPTPCLSKTEHSIRSARLIRRYVAITLLFEAALFMLELFCNSSARGKHSQSARLTVNNAIAIQIPGFEQFREANLCAKGLCLPRPCWNILLPCVLQHRRRVPSELRRFRHSRILLVGRAVQHQQNR